jgi:hypothetical protein
MLTNQEPIGEDYLIAFLSVHENHCRLSTVQTNKKLLHGHYMEAWSTNLKCSLSRNLQ